MASKKAKPPEAPRSLPAAAPQSREELLEALWDAQLRAVLKAVESGDASAATLGVARQFLQDSNITLDTLNNLSWRRSPLGQHVDLSQLPKFDDDDDSNDPTLKGKTDDPLRAVPPFAPPTDDDTE